MGFEEINYFYGNQLSNNKCLYKSIDEKEMIGTLFYQGINNDKNNIPIVKENKEAKHYEIPVKMEYRNISIIVDIFAKPGGKLIRYNNLNLHIYKNDGEYVILQGTETHIFVVGTNKEESKMSVTAIDREYNIHNMDFYYHDNPLDFDLELISYELNGEDYIKTELDLQTKRLQRMWYCRDNRELAKKIKYKNSPFIDIIAPAVILVQDSRLVLNNLGPGIQVDIFNDPSDYYTILYQYTRRSLKESLHSKFIRKDNTVEMRNLLSGYYDKKYTEGK